MGWETGITKTEQNTLRTGAVVLFCWQDGDLLIFWAWFPSLFFFFPDRCRGLGGTALRSTVPFLSFLFGSRKPVCSVRQISPRER